MERAWRSFEVFAVKRKGSFSSGESECYRRSEKNMVFIENVPVVRQRMLTERVLTQYWKYSRLQCRADWKLEDRNL